MAKTRSLEVVISGDARQLNRAFKQAGDSAEHTERRISKFGKAAGLAFGGIAVAAGGAAVIGLQKSANAAIEAEKAQARMVSQLKASGISYKAHAKQIDEVIQKTSKLSGLDDEDLQDAFTNVVRATGSVNKGLKDMSLVADLARARHMDVARAGDLVAKVHNGNVGALKRLGIAIDPVTKAQDKLKASGDKVTAAQMKQAKEQDKQATSQKALAALQRRFSGQAEAYGKTTAGSMERAQVAAENLGEAVGAKLAPFVAKGANALTSLIDRSGEAAGPIRRFSGIAVNAYNAVRAAVSRFVARNREDILSVIAAVRNLGRFFKNVFENVLLPAVRAALPGVREALNGIVTVIRGIVRVVSGIINGDWKRVWDGLKDIVRGAIKGVVGVVKAAVGGIGTALVNAGKGLGAAIVRGIVSAFTGIGGAIKKKLSGAIGALNPFGEGIGKHVGDGLGSGLPSIPNLTGVGAGNLMGAQPALAPFAAIGSRFGLSVSSGRRPGSITSSGNISFHSSGEALDLSNGVNTPQERSFQKFVHDKFGGRLAELIGPVTSLNLKNGSPYPYSAAIQAQHRNHVHVALDTGRPGVGDGIGDVARLARAAGFRGQGLVNAIAIAGAESGFRANASNRNTNGSIDRGYWQINSVHGALSTFDPLGNARAAFKISSGGSNWRPWVTYNTGAYRRFLGQARAAAVGSRGRTPGASAGSRGTGSASHPAASGGGSAPEPVSQFEMATALSDVQIAQAEGTTSTADDLQAKIVRRSIVTARIKKVRAALRKRHLRPQTRLRLTQELASLRGEHNQLQTDIGELRHPAAADTADTGTGTGDGDPNQALIDAIAAQTQAEQEHTQAIVDHMNALQALQNEIATQNKFATDVRTVQMGQLAKGLADFISGQIGGYGGAGGRALTAGAGTVVRY